MVPLFPQGQQTSRDIAQHARRILQDNFDDYDRTDRNRGRHRFTVKGVNIYNKKCARLDILRQNEQLCEEDTREIESIELRIKEIKQFDEAKRIANHLTVEPDVPEAVFGRLDDLLKQPGLSARLLDYLQRTVERDVRDRQEKMDRIIQIVDELDLAQKQKQIQDSVIRQKSLEQQVQDLKLDADRNREAPNELSERYFRIVRSNPDLEKERDEKIGRQIDALTLQSQTTLDQLRNSHTLELNRLQAQLDSVNANIERLTVLTNREKADFRTDIRELNSQVSNLKLENQRLVSGKATLQKECDQLSDKSRRLQDQLDSSRDAKAEADRKVENLEALNEQYLRGQPTDEKELNDARQDTIDNMKLYTRQKEETTIALEELRQCKKLIFRFAFDGSEDIQVDFEHANSTLINAASDITAGSVKRAVRSMESHMVGLPVYAPLAGFQLWVEAIARPQEFAPMKVLAYLRTENTSGYSDIGFLELAVDVLTKNKTGLKGWPALAVLEIFQFWIHLMPSQKEQIQDRLRNFSVKRRMPFSKAKQPFEWFIHSVSLNLRSILRDQSGHTQSRGERVMAEAPDDHILLSGSAIRPHNMIISLDSEPRYSVYVDRGRIVWLKPEDITIRVTASQWFLHDSLETHVIPEQQFQVADAELSKKLAILKGATYIN